ncbi:MAG: helix-turn-helix domain-containing protein [Clostridiales bacterium]|nr:helix-turn-helix domain-containing protein [Clostridiales bacterium]
MAIGERIHFFRKMRGMRLKQLGQAVGFPESNADVRMAQYESGSRTPKADITNRLAKVLDVSPKALTVPDIDNYTGLMHTLFTLEDTYGLKVTELDGQIVLHVDVRQGKDADELHRMLCVWQEQAAKQEAGGITKEDYDRWRYHYPELDTTQLRARVLSPELNDLLMDNLQDDK